MALRLKKDVQKASYYVWFLGAQEARGLRGSRVLLPAIPRLVERSNEQEPLKVTLQVSHKGLKIIQVGVLMLPIKCCQIKCCKLRFGDKLIVDLRRSIKYLIRYGTSLTLHFDTPLLADLLLQLRWC